MHPDRSSPSFPEIFAHTFQMLNGRLLADRPRNYDSLVIRSMLLIIFPVRGLLVLRNGPYVSYCRKTSKLGQKRTQRVLALSRSLMHPLKQTAQSVCNRKQTSCLSEQTVRNSLTTAAVFIQSVYKLRHIKQGACLILCEEATKRRS